MRDVIFREWVPPGTFARAFVGFVSLAVLCVLSIIIATIVHTITSQQVSLVRPPGFEPGIAGLEGLHPLTVS